MSPPTKEAGTSEKAPASKSEVTTTDGTKLSPGAWKILPYEGSTPARWLHRRVVRWLSQRPFRGPRWLEAMSMRAARREAGR